MKLQLQRSFPRVAALAALLLPLGLLAPGCSVESSSTSVPATASTTSLEGVTNQADASPATKAAAPSRSTAPEGLAGLDLSSLAGSKPSNEPPNLLKAPPGETVQIPSASNRKARISGWEGAETTIDFGEVQQGEKGEHVFQLVSDGEDGLVIAKIKPSCGCTLARTSVISADGTALPYQIGDSIPVGARFEIETMLKTDGRAGPLATQVQITANTPEPVTNLRLKAKVEPILAMTPGPNLNFGQMTSNLTREGSLQVSSNVLEPYRLIVDEKFVVAPMTVEVEPVDADAEGKSKTWNIHVSIGPDVPEGFRNYPLRFTTDAPIPQGQSAKNFEVRAYVQAQVTGLVAATPGFVSFGVVRPGQQIERKVILECFDEFELTGDMQVSLEPLQKNLEVPYLDRFTTSIKVMDEAKSRAELTITLQGMPDDFNSSFGGMILVNVGHPLKDEVTVRFSGVCRQGLPSGN